MDGDGKKTLETVITNFLKLHMNKGKAYTFKNIKKFGIHKATIYSWMKNIEEKDRGTRNSSCHP
jgi:transposase